MDSKRCPHCGETKPAEEFYRNSRGLFSYCKPCHRAATNASAKKRRAGNPELMRGLDAQRRALEGYAEKQRVWHARWRTKMEADPTLKAMYAAKEKVWRTAWKCNNPLRRRMNNQIHNNRTRARKKGLQSNFRYQDWLRVLEDFGHACAYCGATAAYLELDHFVALRHGGDNILGNVVPCCRPCNAHKHRMPAAKMLEQIGQAARLPGILEVLHRHGCAPCASAVASSP